MLAGAACAALLSFAMPAVAADYPETMNYGAQSTAPYSVTNAVNAYYSARPGTLLWLKSGANDIAATQLIQLLRRAPLDGLASGPDLAAGAQSLLARASAGDPAARGEADRLLSTAWILYVQALHTPPSGMNFADSWVAPRHSTPAANPRLGGERAFAVAAHCRGQPGQSSALRPAMTSASAAIACAVPGSPVSPSRSSTLSA